jgi:hypothetical protein
MGPNRVRIMSSSFFSSSGFASLGNQSFTRCVSAWVVSGSLPNQKSRT